MLAVYGANKVRCSFLYFTFLCDIGKQHLSIVLLFPPQSTAVIWISQNYKAQISQSLEHINDSITCSFDGTSTKFSTGLLLSYNEAFCEHIVTRAVR